MIENDSAFSNSNKIDNGLTNGGKFVIIAIWKSKS